VINLLPNRTEFVGIRGFVVLWSQTFVGKLYSGPSSDLCRPTVYG